MFCVNLCEIYSSYFFKNNNFESFLTYLSSKKGQLIERIYLGSSFCSQYFLQLSDYEQVFKFCAERGIHITLTLPVFTEKNIGLGKKKIATICKAASEIIDEITVNDIGMLSQFQSNRQYRINLGRLFFKDSRDCRVPEYTKRAVSPMLLSQLNNDYWKSLRFSLVELDPTNKIIDTSYIEKTNTNIGVHLPYCYMTTGNICKFASIHRDVEQKFRPNIQCGMECAHVSDIYSGHVVQTNCDPILKRFGRTLYFKASSIEFVGKAATRVIYFPVDEWRKYADENSGSIK